MLSRTCLSLTIVILPSYIIDQCITNEFTKNEVYEARGGWLSDLDWRGVAAWFGYAFLLFAAIELLALLR